MSDDPSELAVIEELYKQQATALTEARAEIERLRGEISTQEYARTDWKARALAAESELSTLRARVREVVGPFTRYRVRMISSDSVADYSVHVESSTENQPQFKHYAAARQLMEEVK